MLHDYYCSTCNARTVDVYTAPECCGSTMATVCNGGVGMRYRHNDWPEDPAFYRGQGKVTCAATERGDAGEKPLELAGKSGNGGLITDHPTFARDKKAEERDRLYHRNDRKRGKTPITIDMKRAQ